MAAECLSGKRPRADTNVIEELKDESLVRVMSALALLIFGRRRLGIAENAATVPYSPIEAYKAVDIIFAEERKKVGE